MKIRHKKKHGVQLIIFMKPKSKWCCYDDFRFLNHLKKKVTNRARVEASIVEAYLIEETSNFCALYFDTSIETRLNRASRNDDGGYTDEHDCLSVFHHPGRPIGSQTTNFRLLTSEELKAATLYVLLNCQEIMPFIG